MIEKRFFFVIDNGKYTFYDLSENGEIMNMNETEDMLNELNDENDQLKQELESFKPVIFESDGKPVTLYKKVME